MFDQNAPNAYVLVLYKLLFIHFCTKQTLFLPLFNIGNGRFFINSAYNFLLTKVGVLRKFSLPPVCSACIPFILCLGIRLCYVLSYSSLSHHLKMALEFPRQFLVWWQIQAL